MNSQIVQARQTYHYSNKCEQCCACGRHQLTHEETTALLALRTAASGAYDGSKATHVQALQKLGSLLWPEAEPGLRSERWKEVGFQSADPSTDFRGAGFLGLNQMVYFAEQHPSQLAAMLSEEYPWAITSLNATYAVLVLLQLASGAGMPQAQRAHPRAVKAFCGLEPSLAVLDAAYALALLKTHEAWQAMKGQPGVSIMQLQDCVQAGARFVERVLAQAPQDLDEFKWLGLQQLYM